MKQMKYLELKNLLISTEYFVDNNYLDLYLQLIINNINTKRIKYSTQLHHIIPKSYYQLNNLQVDNTSNNLVNLLFTDHIIAHYYISKCCKNDIERTKHGLAVYLMSTYKPDEFNKILNNKQILQECYELSRKRLSQIAKNKKLSEEDRLKISNRTKGKNNPMYGKKRPDTAEFNRKTKIGNKNRLGKFHTEETKQKLSNSIKGKCKGRIWINNGINEKMIPIEHFSEYEINGYTKGRIDSVCNLLKTVNIGKHLGDDNPARKVEVRNKIREKQTGKRIYNNGIINKWFYNTDIIPDEFVHGFLKRV